jgi:transcription-repair coupling factor (superfamily II helicase)
LRESITELKTEEFADTFADVSAGASEEFVAEVTIESDLELRLPPEYVPQESERISLYRRLDNMERPEQVEEFRAHLVDRFGAVPEVTDELIKVVPLRMSAKRLGIERIVLKGGLMRLYFVDDDNKAYYRSPAFGRVLGFLQANPRRCNLKDIPSRDQSAAPKHSLIVSSVPSVSEALSLLTAMEATDAL